MGPDLSLVEKTDICQVMTEEVTLGSNAMQGDALRLVSGREVRKASLGKQC